MIELLLGCTGAPEVEPAPWAQLSAETLELQPLMTTPLLTPGRRIVSMQRRPVAAVLAEDRVLLLDPRWQHEDRVYCLQNPYSASGPQGGCEEGEVELDRASWRTGSPDAVAFDEEGLLAYVVDGDRLYSASVDQLADPWLWMRLDLGVALEEEPTGVVSAWVEQGDIVVAGDALWRFSPDGALIERVDEEQSWEGPQDQRFPEALDVAVTPAHELLVLYQDRVEVFLDEAALADNTHTLRVFNTTFLEKPKSPTEDLPCEGPGDAVVSLVATAVRNRALLDDLPGCHALGITPHAVRRARACGVVEELPGLIGERTELGVLFHEETGCTDGACYAAFLREGAAEVHSLGPSTWVAGLSPNADSGQDWVKGILDADLPPVVPFFGLSLHPEVSHFDDPRSKETWPQDYADWSRPLGANSAWDLEGGAVTLYANDSRSAFAQAGCPNLTLRECQLLGVGDGDLLREEDLALLRLSLHRALAADVEGGTWGWHLPDIGSWDYTEGCSNLDRRWSGCQGGLVQDFLMDLHARYVLNGLAQWTPPSRL